MMIFLFFKPLTIKEQEFIDVPLFEIKNFTMYELSTKGMKTFLTGDSSTRYEDRYLVLGMDYTDNSKKYIANMKANQGLYRDTTVDLSGDVFYAREDGLTFESQEMTYDKKTSIAKSNSKYIAYRGENSMSGTSIEYNGLLNKVKSKNIVVIYQLEEKKI